MNARNRISTLKKTAGTIVLFLLFFLMSTSFQNIPPTDGFLEKAFKLDNMARETVELTIEQPGPLYASVEWSPADAELALILFGPGKMNYYERSDGKSPLELNYTMDSLDIVDGKAWRIKLVNQSGETVEGMVRITYPVKEPAGEDISL